MKLGRIVVAALMVGSTLGGSGCSRNRQEAVLKANEADKEVALNPEGAIAKYEEATKLDATSYKIFFKLGMAYKKKEDWEKAASTFGRAAALAPTFANYFLEQGYALE